MPITQISSIMRPKALSLLASLALLALLLATTSIAQAQSESLENHAGLPSRIEGSWIFSPSDSTGYNV